MIFSERSYPHVGRSEKKIFYNDTIQQSRTAFLQRSRAIDFCFLCVYKAISNVLVNSRYYNEAKFSTKIILQNCTLFFLNNPASKFMQLYISFTTQELKLTKLLLI